jgi:hypothetical protein
VAYTFTISEIFLGVTYRLKATHPRGQSPHNVYSLLSSLKPTWVHTRVLCNILIYHTQMYIYFVVRLTTLKDHHAYVCVHLLGKFVINDLSLFILNYKED